MNGDWFFRDKVFRPGEGHGWSAHDHAVLTLVVQGRLDEGLEGEVQTCGALELHYKPRGLPHATSTGPDGVRMLMIGLRGSAQEEVEGGEKSAPRTIPAGAGAARALAELLAIAGSPGRQDEMPREPIRRLWDCLQANDPHPNKRPNWITEVDERVRAEGAAPERLSDLAGEFRVHPVYLARAFRASYGTTIGSVRRRLRAERALLRLRTETMPLADLALDLGYADQNHFCRELKRQTGWTPARFRAVCSSLAEPTSARHA